MVVFTCNHCGESLQKPRVEKHYQTSCRNPIAVTCMDCFKDFRLQEYATHNKCITEEQRYSAKGSVPGGAKKGEIKQLTWVAQINNILETEKNLKPNERKLLEFVANNENIPRKKAKFINFMKSSTGGRVNFNDIEAVWNIIEKHKNLNTPTQNDQQNSAKQEETSENNIKEEVVSPVKEEVNIKKEPVSSTEEEPETKKKKKRKIKEEAAEETQNPVEELEEVPKKKKKKSKKDDENTPIEPEKTEIKEEANVSIKENGDLSSKKKKNKKKTQDENLEDSTIQNGESPNITENPDQIENGDLSSSKKKKKKNKQNGDSIDKMEISITEENDETSSKKKKKNQKQLESSLNGSNDENLAPIDEKTSTNQTNDTNQNGVLSSSKKKNKKSKTPVDEKELENHFDQIIEKIEDKLNSEETNQKLNGDSVQTEQNGVHLDQNGDENVSKKKKKKKSKIEQENGSEMTNSLNQSNSDVSKQNGVESTKKQKKAKTDDLDQSNCEITQNGVDSSKKQKKKAKNGDLNQSNSEKVQNGKKSTKKPKNKDHVHETKDDGFSWKTAILEILNEKKTIPKSDLENCVFKKFKKLRDSQANDKLLHKNFERKLKKIKNAKIENDVVTLE